MYILIIFVTCYIFFNYGFNYQLYPQSQTKKIVIANICACNLLEFYAFFYRSLHSMTQKSS